MDTFKSTNNLGFYARPFLLFPSSMDFKVGTCKGLYRVEKNKYILIAIINRNPHNGHFQDVFEWFENSCKRDKCDLVVAEIFNKKLQTHLINKMGFKNYKKMNGVIKSYQNMG